MADIAFKTTAEAIALCLSMVGTDLPGACHDGPGGMTWLALSQLAIRRGLYDSTAGCPVTRPGTVTEHCPPPDGKTCITIGRYSMPPAYPHGSVYLCRTITIPVS